MLFKTDLKQVIEIEKTIAANKEKKFVHPEKRKSGFEIVYSFLFFCSVFWEQIAYWYYSLKHQAYLVTFF